MTAPPVALTIAGSDTSSGAGIQADLKTFAACGVYGLNAVTGVVAEVPGRVARIVPMSAVFVAEQIKVLAASFPIAAVKTGLLCNREIVIAVAKACDECLRGVPLVVDPVMIATSGDALLDPPAIAAYETELFSRATLITPNADEAAKLAATPAATRDEARAAAAQLARQYGTSVLLKGGHVRTDAAIDFLATRGDVLEFASPRTPNVRTHGTGCTYSAAIAAFLARGENLESSVPAAKRYVSAAIHDHFTWETPSGTIHALNHAASIVAP